MNITNSRTVHREPAQHVDFGMTDERGRAVGFVVHRWTLETTPAPAGQVSGGLREPGTWFVVGTCPTRNGKEFGASTRLGEYRTADERDREAARRTEAARKRYAKKLAPK